MKLTKIIPDPNNIVFKLIFEDKNAIAEAVVYRYNCRGVICFSVQSGCKVGCVFCGTGKRFIRNLSTNEMILQINEGLKLLKDYDKIQIMSMSMGEPMDNMGAVSNLIFTLNKTIREHDFFLSTVGLNDPIAIKQLINLFSYKHFGLQFSLHHYNNEKRKKLLGNYPKLLDINEIKTIADLFKLITKKRAYFNYIVTEIVDILEICNIVEGHHLTCSTLCNTKEFKKGDVQIVEKFINNIKKTNTFDIELSMFNPEGQDTIGGGCGQLLYVQKKLKEVKINGKESKLSDISDETIKKLKELE